MEERINEMEYNKDSRERMKAYWSKHSTNASMEEMLLDTNAEIISKNDLPEVVSLMPNFKSKNVLELGSGIGRLTRELAKQASNVTAVDFIEKFVEKNRETNSNFNNIEFIHGDVTKLEFKNKFYDIIFSNWLLMYLDDNEVLGLFEKTLKTLKAEGFFFFRESCFHPSGNIKNANENPTYYRSPSDYINNIQSILIEENGEQYGFELVFSRPSRTYIEIKNNGNQIFFLFKKCKINRIKSNNEFFDRKQYTIDGILKYERIFGNGFISPGGSHTTEEFLKTLDLKPDQRVLDVGCGIGGGDFIMAEKYGVEVFGLDLSSNTVGIAWDRLQSLNKKDLKVRFEIGDVTKQEYPSEYFDVIYSRDTILHIQDKKELFSRFKDWLKPGGKVFITDYCCGPKPWSNEYAAYVEQRGYTLLTPAEYGQIFQDLDYENVIAEDKTDMFVYYLNFELSEFEKIKDEFINEFSKEDYDYIVKGWHEKLVRCSQGHQKWGLFRAEKKIF